MSHQMKNILIFFPHRFQEERYDYELAQINKEKLEQLNKEQQAQPAQPAPRKKYKKISRLPKSFSVIVSYPTHFVPVLKPKKPLYSSINIGEFSLEHNSDFESIDKNEAKLKRSKSYGEKTNMKAMNCKLSEQIERNRKSSKDEYKNKSNTFNLYDKQIQTRRSRLILKHVFQRNNTIHEAMDDECKENESSDECSN